MDRSYHQLLQNCLYYTASAVSGPSKSGIPRHSDVRIREKQTFAWDFLLSPEAQVFGSRLEIRAKRIDVQTAAAVVASVHRQFFRVATRFDIEKDSLDAGLVKVVVLPERYDVPE